MPEESEKKLSKSKMKDLSLILTIVFIILVVVIIFLVVKNTPASQELLECGDDSDCVKVLTTCCDCEMGGIEKCVPSGQQAIFIPKDCNDKPVCIALYNCEIKKCVCVQNKCTEVIGEKTQE